MIWTRPLIEAHLTLYGWQALQGDQWCGLYSTQHGTFINLNVHGDIDHTGATALGLCIVDLSKTEMDSLSNLEIELLFKYMVDKNLWT